MTRCVCSVFVSCNFVDNYMVTMVTMFVNVQFSELMGKGCVCVCVWHLATEFAAGACPVVDRPTFWAIFHALRIQKKWPRNVDWSAIGLDTLQVAAPCSEVCCSCQHLLVTNVIAKQINCRL